MARYELGAEFWDITRNGVRLVIVAGTGSAGKESVRTFVSEVKAEAQLVKLVGDKLAAGYVFVDKPTQRAAEVATEDRDAALEAAIVANPYDEAAYSVYGDWLQGRGAPRGELVALQLAEEADPDNRKLAAATRAYLESHRALVPELDVELTDHDDAPALLWRFGFIHRISLARGPDDDNYNVAAVLEQVLRHPSARFVTEIAIRDSQAARIEAAIPVIGTYAPPTLRALSLIGFGTLGSFDTICNLPLTHLTVKATRRGDATSDLAPQCLRSLARVPATLETLAIRFGGDELIDHLAPLFARTDLTALRELKLRGWVFAGEACRRLASSPFGAQLESIDLGLAELETAGLAMLGDRARFPKLRRVGVALDLVSSKQLGPLRARGLKIEDRRRDPDDVDDDEDFFDEVEE